LNTPSPARRRLIKGGLAGAPVLMTVVARPALGQQCLTPSAFGSGNLSRPGGGGVPCNGATPGYWIGHVAEFPAAFPPTKSFTSVFGSGGGISSNSSLLDMLSGGNPLASNIVAAFLNAVSGRNVTPSADVVKGIWGEVVTTGHFSPVAGVTWLAADIIAYLQSTMPVH
jgi:hypothetical protein